MNTPRIDVTLHSILVRSPDATHQVVGDEAVLLDLRSEAYFGLNELALRIWESLGDGVTLMQVADHLAQQYEVERGRLERDVLGLASLLVQEGLAIPASRP